MSEDSHIITFLRHGESVGNMENRHQGQADFPLTEKGRRQAEALAQRWQEEKRTFERAISSPLLRARQTAEIICTALGVALEFDPLWMEIDSGMLSGLTHEEGKVQVPEPAFFTPYTRWGVNGESRWLLYLRAGQALQKLLEQPPGNYLVVAHGGILNMTLYAALGIQVQSHRSGVRFMFDNTTFTTLTYEPTEHIWRMLTFGDRAHWKDD